MEKSEFIHLKTREKEAQHKDVFGMLYELIGKIPDLVKEKYSNILFDFLGPCKGSCSMDLQIWYVDVPLDQVTIAKFECKTCGNFKGCTLKSLNDEHFDGDVQFYLYEYEHDRMEIYIRSLYVADHKPFISGKIIVNLVKQMTDSRPGVVATLNDASNVKILALLTTGKSYYEYMGFHYVNTSRRKKTRERHNFQKTKINSSLLLKCMLQKLDERIQVREESFMFSEKIVRNESIKQGILKVLRAEVGQGSRCLEDFWKIYRNVMKNIDFCFLQKKFNFKTHIFTRYLRECLLEQIYVDEEIFRLGGMIYP